MIKNQDFELQKLEGVSSSYWRRLSPVMDEKIEPIENYGLEDKYRLEARLYVEFTANKAQRDRAVENARKRIMRYIYQDAIGAVLDIRQALYASDVEQTLELLDKLQRHMENEI